MRKQRFNPQTLLFDRIAGLLRENNVTSSARTSICSGLIAELLAGGWNDAHASMNRFSEDVAILRAFEENGVEA